MASVSETEIPLAAEDRFVVIGIRDAKRLCPEPEVGEQFNMALPKQSLVVIRALFIDIRV